MSAPGIERLEAAIVTQLQEIQVANGYRSDVAKVYRVPLIADQIPEGNNLVLVPAPDGMGFDGQDPDHYRLTDRLIVGGTVSKGQADLFDSDRVTAANLFLQDVLDALIEDPSFGFKPNCDSVLEVGDRGVDADRGFAYFTIRLHITYPFSRGTM